MHGDLDCTRMAALICRMLGEIANQQVAAWGRCEICHLLVCTSRLLSAAQPSCTLHSGSLLQHTLVNMHAQQP